MHVAALLILLLWQASLIVSQNAPNLLPLGSAACTSIAIKVAGASQVFYVGTLVSEGTHRCPVNPLKVLSAT